MYHKQLVRNLFPAATLRRERAESGLLYLLREGPETDARCLGGGYGEEEAWINAALSVVLELEQDRGSDETDPWLQGQ